MIKRHDIISFDKTEHIRCESIRPEKYEDIFKTSATPMIARGAGLSYCNASVVSEGMVVDMRRMNKIISFEPDTGIITAEAGMTIGELNNFLITKNYNFPVLPGYPSITLGGCVAFNVHGKSQYKVGTFGDAVRSLHLFHPSHGEIMCSPESNKEIFDLTIGGMGLTGIILSVTLKPQKLRGGWMDSQRIFVKNIYESITIMQSSEQDYEYVYSWNNMNKRGDMFGAGVVYLEKFGTGDVKVSGYRDRLNGNRAFTTLHNDFTIKTMCSVFYLMEKIKGKDSRQDLHRGSFPIYHKEIYYYLFGKRGFREYQVLLPYSSYMTAIDEIRQLISTLNVAVALGSLKLFSGKSHYLSFTGEGVCLTLDVQSNKKSLEFFTALDAIAIKHRAIVNLSKDSRIGSTVVQQLFPEFNSFKEQLRKFDPNVVMNSELRKRIGL